MLVCLAKWKSAWPWGAAKDLSHRVTFCKKLKLSRNIQFTPKFCMHFVSLGQHVICGAVKKVDALFHIMYARINILRWQGGAGRMGLPDDVCVAWVSKA